jgi:hypothetical protein
MSFGHTAIGVFPNREGARDAIVALKAAGFAGDEIGIVSRGVGLQEDNELPADPTHSRWEEGTGIGAAAGATTGLGLGLAVAAGLMPPIGPVIAGGTLMALIASAGAGATVGSVLGGLIGLGVPEDDAAYYDEAFRTGSTLVTCRADDRYDEGVAIMQRFGAVGRPATVAP